jgi:hypothetical protein
MDGCLGLIRSLFTLGISLWIFSSCGTALFFSKTAPTTNVKPIEQLDTRSNKNPTTKKDLNELITYKVLKDGNPISDPNNPGNFLYVEADRSKVQNQTDFIGRFYKSSPDDDQDWVADGKPTIEYDSLAVLYKNPYELKDLKYSICQQFFGESTYNKDGKFNYDRPQPLCQ